MDRSDLQLLHGVFSGDFDVVKSALEAGGNVNGPPGRAFPPIVAATMASHAGMVNFLMRKGADPDRPVTKEVPCPNLGTGTTTPGERAVHIAARSGDVEIVRLLLKRYHADPNVADNTGCTPLMDNCESTHERAEEVGGLLLEAGADPALAQEDGLIPLHFAALQGHMGLVDMLYSRAPATVNHCAANGDTPLYVACNEGRESMVSKLLSLGAMQAMALGDRIKFPLVQAVFKGFVGIVRVLFSDGGIPAVGGDMALAQALQMAVRNRRAGILRLLLTADGEEKRSEWANIKLDNRHLLHYGAGFCCPAAVNVLLEAGADEAARDPEGCIPREVIGADLGRDDEPEMDLAEEVAVRRMLQRGPAFRARSWAWPSCKEADAGSSGDDDTAVIAAAAAAADDDAAAPSSPPDMRTPTVIGVRTFRPKGNNRRELFVRLVGRYAAKD